METFFDYELQEFSGVDVFKSNLNKNYLAKFIDISDTFTTEILQIWSEISYVYSMNSINHFLALPLWHNSHFKIGNKPIYYKSWSYKGIQTISHLIKDTDKFLSFPQFCLATKVSKPNRMAYEKPVSAKQKRPTKSQEKWCVDMQPSLSDSLSVAQKLPN